MIGLRIDGRPVQVEEGATILDAARRLGIEIPTLCHAGDLPHQTACMVCLVYIRDKDAFQPACATIATEGLCVESGTPRVRAMRREALELLLAEHLGDCEGPCRMTCPTFMDIPAMLRAVASGDSLAALRVVHGHMALPAVLGALCPAPCERACRRAALDRPLPIRETHRQLAEMSLADGADVPACAASGGRRVAVVGAGPCGLAAAFHLRLAGHAVTLLEAGDAPGCGLRDGIDAERLPRASLDADTARILRMGVRFQRAVLGLDESPATLLERFDAALLAVGALDDAAMKRLGLAQDAKGLRCDRQTGRIDGDGRLFAAGACVRPMKFAVQAVAAGRNAAVAIDQMLAGTAPTGFHRPLNVAIHAPTPDELRTLDAVRGASAGEGAAAGGRSAAAGCLHCDCRKAATCGLRRHADALGARTAHHRMERRMLELDATHPEVLLEPGKCIDCGLCVALAEQDRREAGLAFVGRGFAVRVAVPLEADAAHGIAALGTRMAGLCPTGAISRRDQPRNRD